VYGYSPIRKTGNQPIPRYNKKNSPNTVPTSKWPLQEMPKKAGLTTQTMSPEHAKATRMRIRLGESKDTLSHSKDILRTMKDHDHTVPFH
jgi:hypothetical protein